MQDDMHELLDLVIRYLVKESAAPSPNCVVGEACMAAMLNITCLPGCTEGVKERVYNKIKQCCDVHNLRLQLVARQALLRFMFLQGGMPPVLEHAVEYVHTATGPPCISQAMWEEVADLAGLATRSSKPVTMVCFWVLALAASGGVVIHSPPCPYCRTCS
jgi:hypothetical protein